MSPKATATARAQRILAILPWIVENGGATITDLCERFDVTPEQLRSDLDLVFVDVGLHPFTPDALIDVAYEGDWVTVSLGDYFRRPARLSPEEGLTLLTAGRAVLGRPGEADPTLSNAVDKLAAVIGTGAGDAVDVSLGAADASVLSTVEAAVSDHRQLVIRYYSYGRDTASDRTVDPYRLTSDRGHWYLYGHCHSSEDERLFRVDRILRAEATDTVFEAPESIADDDPFDLAGAARTIELVTPPDGGWITTTYPCDDVEKLPDGRWRIVLKVTALPWLERLLLRLGPDVEVIDVESGASLRHIGEAAARRVLARYGSTDS